MKLNSFLKLSWMVIAAASLMACVRYHDDYDYKYKDWNETSFSPTTTMPHYNSSIRRLEKSWTEIEDRWDAVSNHSSFSPRYALELGYACASAADVINTWTITTVGWDGWYAGQSIERLLREFDSEIYSNALSLLPLDNPANYQDFSLIVSSTEIRVYSLFFGYMTSKTEFGFKPNPPLLRVSDEVMQKAMDAKNAGDDFSTCYWLGVMARESEKKNLALDGFWATCGFDGIHKNNFPKLGDIQ